MKVEIEKLDHFGRGITYVEGKVCFVDKTLPGEIVKIDIVKETKKYFIGKVLDYYRLSEHRIDEICIYSDICGGCNLSHLSYDEENNYKCIKVKEILKKFGNVSDDKIEETVFEDEYGYRNKVTLHGKNNNLGYCEKKSNNVFSVNECLLANEKVNSVIEFLKKNTNKMKIEEALIRTSNDLSEVMLSIKGNVKDSSCFEGIVDTFLANDELVFGNGYIYSTIGEKKYYVSADSFFQVNKDLTVKLYNEVARVVKNVKPKKVLDLYCGTGTIGIFVSELVSEVVGVDYSYSGIQDAVRNSELNNCNNIKFICDKVENVIDKFSDIDMVIVDPPRAGLDINTIENIKRIASDTVIYISCDPVTLARDLKLLEGSYEILYVKPYNMFPRTYHIENFVELKRRNK